MIPYESKPFNRYQIQPFKPKRLVHQHWVVSELFRKRGVDTKPTWHVLHGTYGSLREANDQAGYLHNQHRTVKVQRFNRNERQLIDC